MGDKRVYGYIIVLRAVTTTDFMTAEACEFTEHGLIDARALYLKAQQRLTWRPVEFPWKFLQRVTNRIINEVQGYVIWLQEGFLSSSARLQFRNSAAYPFHFG